MNQHSLSKAVVRDYIYKELSELEKVILSRKTTYKEVARQRRNFLEGQLRIVSGNVRWWEDLDPMLVSSVLPDTSKFPRSPRDQASKQPPYWDKCEEMDFRQLREFIDDSLERLSEHASKYRPRSKEEFLKLCRMLYVQIRNARHLEFANRVRADIERIFKYGAIPPHTIRVPWRVLPTGKSSLDDILRHYDELEHLSPKTRYERDRLVKAYSLHPKEVALGSAEFRGYIVFTFDHTKRVLLECPMYGNAIYIIDSEWKSLSKLTKRELLEHREATKIVHRGDWFWRLAQELETGRGSSDFQS